LLICLTLVMLLLAYFLSVLLLFFFFFSFTDPAPTEIYTLSLHDALPIFIRCIENFGKICDTLLNGFFWICNTIHFSTQAFRRLYRVSASTTRFLHNHSHSHINMLFYIIFFRLFFYKSPLFLNLLRNLIDKMT